ncbi:MAG: DUF2442 domain-containing protein [Kiritimatiellae bacterium]|nr:DUF2442 domain-containing protein [Kiritimatiellia bacterium]
MKKYPKVRSVKPFERKKLFVTFSSGTKKIYDCIPLLNEEVFSSLKDDAFFKNVHPDKHGYGIIWNDQIDLSETELWVNGITTEQAARSDSFIS